MFLLTNFLRLIVIKIGVLKWIDNLLLFNINETMSFTIRCFILPNQIIYVGTSDIRKGGGGRLAISKDIRSISDIWLQ